MGKNKTRKYNRLRSHKSFNRLRKITNKQKLKQNSKGISTELWKTTENNLPTNGVSSSLQSTKLLKKNKNVLVMLNHYRNQMEKYWKKIENVQKTKLKIYNACIRVAYPNITEPYINLPLFHVNRATTANWQKTYKTIFGNLSSEYLKYVEQNQNWQFLDYYFGLDANECVVRVVSPHVANIKSFIDTGNKPLEQDSNLMDHLYNHVVKVIGDANLGPYLKSLITNNYVIRISLDFYVGRPNSRNMFHKDLRSGTNLYVCLTFDTNEHERIPGPELTHFNTACTTNIHDMQHQVVRPIVYGPYGQIGFNDQILIHSTPYSGMAEKQGQIFDTHIPFHTYKSHLEKINNEANPNYTENNFFNKRIKPSKNRTEYSTKKINRPDFLRTSIEFFPPDETGALTTNLIDRVVFNNNIISKEYNQYRLTEEMFDKTFMSTETVNILENVDIIDSITNLNPMHLNDIFENVCDSVINMG